MVLVMALGLIVSFSSLASLSAKIQSLEDELAKYSSSSTPISTVADNGLTQISIKNGNLQLGNYSLDIITMESALSDEWVDWNNNGQIHAMVSDHQGHFHVLYRNELLNEVTTVHAHGQSPPASLDGVPYVSAPPIESNQVIRVSFLLARAVFGTFFLHSHWGFQHGRGMTIPYIIDALPPADYPLYEIFDLISKQPRKERRDYLFFIEDFCPYSTMEMPMNGSTTMSMPSMTMPSCPKQECLFNMMSMMKETSPSDCSAGHYIPVSLKKHISYRVMAVNRQSFDDPSYIALHKGDTHVRIRVINAASMSNYKIFVGSGDNSDDQRFFQVGFENARWDIKATITSSDGQWTHPIEANEFWIGVAQRIDIILTIPKEFYTIKPGSQRNFISVLAVSEVSDNADALYAPMLVVYEEEHHFDGHLWWDAGLPATWPFARVGMMDHELEDMLSSYPNEIFADIQQGHSSPPDKSFKLVLTHLNGKRYINNITYSIPPVVETYSPHPEPMEVSYKDIVEIEIINQSDDSHAMHLHGHVFQVVEIDGKVKVDGALHDTVVVGGGCHSIKIRFQADNPGYFFC